MKKKTYHPFNRKRILPWILFIVLVQNIQAQRDVPKMWVSKDVSRNRMDLFTTKKQILDLAIGGQHPDKYFFTIASVKDLIKQIESNYKVTRGQALNVYIAACDNDQDSTSPVGTMKKNQLVIIFAPAIKSKRVYHDIGTYYTINITDYSVHAIPVKDKNAWVGNYINNIVGDKTRGLASTIADSRENYTGQTLSDTRSLSYLYSDFKDFITTEREFQDTSSTEPITGIDLCFAAYPDTGIGCNYYGYPLTDFKNRLLLQFEFTKKRGATDEIFYIDDLGGFENRSRDGLCNKVSLGGDNGQLCPPNCPR